VVYLNIPVGLGCRFALKGLNPFVIATKLLDDSHDDLLLEFSCLVVINVRIVLVLWIWNYLAIPATHSIVNHLSYYLQPLKVS